MKVEVPDAKMVGGLCTACGHPVSAASDAALRIGAAEHFVYMQDQGDPAHQGTEMRLSLRVDR
jgi:hypothetical protein